VVVVEETLALGCVSARVSCCLVTLKGVRSGVLRAWPASSWSGSMLPELLLLLLLQDTGEERVLPGLVGKFCSWVHVVNILRHCFRCWLLHLHLNLVLFVLQLMSQPKLLRASRTRLPMLPLPRLRSTSPSSTTESTFKRGHHHRLIATTTLDLLRLRVSPSTLLLLLRILSS
jgi:hypothetical protein